MVVRHALVAVALAAAATVSTACSTLLGAEPTPVPGAAATLTRSINTPIPTPPRTPSPGASPSPLRVATVPSPSAASGPNAQALSDADIADLQRKMEQAVATSSLNGIEALLLDHVALSTPEGGNVMDSTTAANWLRDRASAEIKVTRLERGTQDVMLQVQTAGWQVKDPIQQGRVDFSLRRYDANGRQDETGGGEWKIDVIQAE